MLKAAKANGNMTRAALSILLTLFIPDTFGALLGLFPLLSEDKKLE